jgi:hypothetical protein
MNKRWVAAALLLAGSMAFADSVKVIVPFEEGSTAKPAEKKQLSPEQQRQEELYRERIRQRDEMNAQSHKAHEEFVREQRKKHEEQERERLQNKEEWQRNLKR